MTIWSTRLISVPLEDHPCPASWLTNSFAHFTYSVHILACNTIACVWEISGRVSIRSSYTWSSAEAFCPPPAGDAWLTLHFSGGKVPEGRRERSKRQNDSSVVCSRYPSQLVQQPCSIISFRSFRTIQAKGHVRNSQLIFCCIFLEMPGAESGS